MTEAIAFALRNWKLLLGGIALAALSIYAAIQHSDAVHWRKVAGGFEQGLNLEVAKHAVTRASVGALGAALKAKNAEGIARAEAFERTTRANTAQVAALNARWKAGETQRARLQALVSNPPNEACRAPVALVEALEGL